MQKVNYTMDYYTHSSNDLCMHKQANQHFPTVKSREEDRISLEEDKVMIVKG